MSNLKILENTLTKMFLQAIAVETEQTLNSITRTVFSILGRKPFELFVHCFMEVITQKEGPETINCIHLLKKIEKKEIIQIKKCINTRQIFFERHLSDGDN